MITYLVVSPPPHHGTNSRGMPRHRSRSVEERVAVDEALGLSDECGSNHLYLAPTDVVVNSKCETRWMNTQTLRDEPFGARLRCRLARSSARTRESLLKHPTPTCPEKKPSSPSNHAKHPARILIQTAGEHHVGSNTDVHLASRLGCKICCSPPIEALKSSLRRLRHIPTMEFSNCALITRHLNDIRPLNTLYTPRPQFLWSLRVLHLPGEDASGDGSHCHSRTSRD